MKNVTPGTMENVYSHRSKSSCPLQFLSREEMERNFDECTLNLDQLKGTLLCSVLKPSKQVARGASIDASSQEEHGPHSSQLLCTPCRKFYKKYILLSAEQAKKVSEYSQGSTEWFQERSLRITASEARSIPIKAHPEKWVERRIHPTFRGSTSTRFLAQLRQYGVRRRHCSVDIRCESPAKNIADPASAEEWMQQYKAATNTSWIVKYNKTNCTRMVYHKVWYCQHSKRNKTAAGRHTDCQARVDIKI
ncbi:hypothetical protein HPB49_009332 [Dermacentor silvarum]|uniref:Uncharacterized protein n=1 Tax=Dermacentor silvarum TaxID=543639 RepID=A0ACB8DC18_DERSI|nr:hypothetical protein HPB49_009332 [Dermacentor silvarum]